MPRISIIKQVWEISSYEQKEQIQKTASKLFKGKLAKSDGVVLHL